MKIVITTYSSRFSKICHNVNDVFDYILAITNNPDVAMDVQGWSDLACYGETYETDEFTATAE